MTEKAGSLRWNDSKRCWQVRLALPPGAVVEWVDLPAEIGRNDVARAEGGGEGRRRRQTLESIGWKGASIGARSGAPNKGRSLHEHPQPARPKPARVASVRA